MTTLAANKPRAYELGERNDFPVIAADILYEGAAAGIVAGTGLIRPLVAGDRFAGFMEYTADNSLGAASAIYGRVVDSGEIELPVTGAVITDVGLPVYASDDDTFSFSPVGGSFIGFVKRYVSAGIAVVSFDADELRDPYAGWTHIALDVNTTIDATHTGKWIWCATDAVVFTLPAVEGINFLRIGNLGAFGAAKISVSPNAVDMIEGPGITAADDKDLINTKATARRGDWIEIAQGDANGWSARFSGTWAREA